MDFINFNESTSALKIRNYRLYFFGQVISCIGTFMQTIAQQWLILQLTNSGIEFGLVTALQFLPVLLLAPIGGAIVDRFPKRKIIFFTQISLSLLAVMLGTLVITNLIQVWMVYLFALSIGLISTINLPAEQAFIYEIVGKEELKNAVTLDKIQFNLARIIGPIIGSIAIFSVGLAACFILNGISYLALIFALSIMKKDEIKENVISENIDISAGAKYILSSKPLLYTLIIGGIIGTLTYEFNVSLPLIAKFTFNGDAGTYPSSVTSMGIGAILGGIITTKEKKTTVGKFIKSTFSWKRNNNYIISARFAFI